MMDWEEIIRAESVEELKEAKLWLFREYIRLQNEQKELETSRENAFRERNRFRKEMDELGRKMAQEKKRMKEDGAFFDQKMEILMDGFRKLEEDRRRLEREKRAFIREKADMQEQTDYAYAESSGVSLLFKNVNNPLTVRKRYRDLVKIFHPDNLLGDAELMQMINKEYVRKRNEM